MATTAASYLITDIVEGSVDDLNEDLNGECFIAGAEGEAEVFITNNIVSFPADFPAATDASALEKIVISGAQMAAFVIVNTKTCVDAGRPIEMAVRIAYLRFLSARNGLISPSFTVALHNVRYNHARRVAQTCAEILARTDGDVATANAVAAFKRVLLPALRRDISVRFTNLVCCVAYMFRVRGHHYMADFVDRYTTLWARCLYKPEDLPLAWELVATDALHAIMPDILDNFWEMSAREARCAGTLIKRFDSAPAGAAGVIALDRGLKDVTMLFPAVVEKVPDAYAEFRSMVNQVQNSRWGGSINARFYGAIRHRVDEAKIGALASVVLGVYEHLAPQSKLRDSMALQRLAQVAPATGGAIGMAAARAARDERLNLIDYAVGSASNVAPAP